MQRVNLSQRRCQREQNRAHAIENPELKSCPVRELKLNVILNGVCICFSFQSWSMKVSVFVAVPHLHCVAPSMRKCKEIAELSQSNRERKTPNFPHAL